MAIESWGSPDAVQAGLSDSSISTPGGVGVRPSADQTAAITGQATDPQKSGNVVNNGSAPQVSY
jgi:hypothetical protein